MFSYISNSDSSGFLRGDQAPVLYKIIDRILPYARDIATGYWKLPYTNVSHSNNVQTQYNSANQHTRTICWYGTWY